MLPITGTFLDEITCDITPHNWGIDEWRREFATMRDAGLDTVIIIRTGFRDMAAYPSEAMGIRDVPDLVRLFLDLAAEHGLALYCGCFDPGNMGYEWKEWQACWEVNRRVIPEQWRRYGGHPAFRGWYVSPETVWGGPNARELFPRLAGAMKEQADLPVLISPGWPSYIYRDDSPDVRHGKFIEEWDTVFRTAGGTINLAAFQDGSCCYGNDFDQCFELDRWLAETGDLCRAHGLALWHNIESFSWKFPVKFPPQDWRYLKRRMEIASRHAEKLITFEFPHFLSPHSIFESARHLYARYRDEILGENPRLMRYPESR